MKSHFTFRGLRARLMLVVGMAVLPTVVIFLITAAQQRQLALSRAEENNLRIARLAAATLHGRVEGARQLLAALAESPPVRARDAVVCRAKFNALLKIDREYLNVGLADVNGRVIASALSWNGEVNLTDRPWFRQAVESRSFAVGEFQIGRITGAPSVNFAQPVLDGEGRVQAVVFLALSLRTFDRITRHLDLERGMTLTVTDRRGRILALHPPQPQRIGLTSPTAAWAQTMVRERTAAMERSESDRVPWLVSCTSVGPAVRPHLFIEIALPRDLALAPLHQVFRRNLAVLLVLITLVLVATALFSDRFIVRWVDALVVAARRVAGGDLSARARIPPGQGELSNLGGAFDQMSEALAQRAAERQQVEQALRESEERFRSLSASSPLGIFLADSEGHWVYANPRCRAICGFSLMQGIRDGWLQYLHPEDRERVVEQWQAAIRERRELSCEFRLESDGQAVRWIHLRACPVVSDSVQIKGHVGTLEEITERKRSEQALRESEERYRSLVETAQDVIFTLSLSGEFTSLNPAFQIHTGWPVGQWLGRSFLPLVMKEDVASALSVFHRVRAGERVPAFTIRIRSRTDQVVFAQLTATPLFRNGVVDGILGIARNITEQKRLEAEFLQAQKMDAIGRLAGGVAHDFNNILTAIVGYSEVLLRQLPAGHPLCACASEIKRAVDRAASLTRQLLAFGRRQTVQPVVLDLHQVVAEMDQMLRRLIGENISLLTRSADGLWPVRADRAQLQQVLLNLVVNARDAMPDGGSLTIETANCTLTSPAAEHPEQIPPGEYVRLEVRDSGCGMSEEVMRHLFEPFFTTKEAGKGTGLGLATVYGIIKQHGGWISVASEPGKGSSFRVWLRRVYEAVEPVPSAEADSPLPAGRENILLVEDEEAVRELVAMVLREQGYRVFCASNGVDALQKLQELNGTPLDLLITDVIMPQMGGTQLASRVRVLHPHVRVLFVSGYSSESVSTPSVAFPHSELLEKPFTSAVLLRKVREVLDRQPPSPAGSAPSSARQK